jgi:hypothetical protein
MVGGGGADTFIFAGRTPIEGDSPLTNVGSKTYFRADPAVRGTQQGDVIFDFNRSSGTFNAAEGDRLDFFGNGANASNYIEEQSIIRGNLGSDPTVAYDNALALANQNFAARGGSLQAGGATFVAVEILIGDGNNAQSGVLIFFETSGDDIADQQVFLQGVTIANLDNFGSFII